MLGFRKLRQYIIDKINDTVSELDEEEKKIGTAVWSPADEGEKPIVVVLPEDLNSTYQETKDSRRRVFIFRVYIMEELSGREQTDVEKELSDGIDFLINLFDRKNALDEAKSLGLLHIKPTPSVWGNVDYSGGQARVATLTLQCDVIVDN